MITSQDARPCFVALHLGAGRPLQIPTLQNLNTLSPGVQSLHMDSERRVLHILYDEARVSLEAIVRQVRLQGYEVVVPGHICHIDGPAQSSPRAEAMTAVAVN